MTRSVVMRVKSQTIVTIIENQHPKSSSMYRISSHNNNDLHFKWFICKNSFTNPVVTKCRQYFCEKCALDAFKKSQRCTACGKNTHGTVNPAKELIRKLEKHKKQDDEECGDASEKSDDSDDNWKSTSQVQQYVQDQFPQQQQRLTLQVLHL